ncbi:uncharacterized protein LOC120112369 [Phoenix dactylifera]|uniref:Uncharacterized protein LOC120112369 n=1 Tax=Phoenix dactylifera TaxID=42345 RepID=A0A8B9APC2_PHODC|nr:uncharacterized protein LOC120112369 [Phoenix dactylifera]
MAEPGAGQPEAPVRGTTGGANPTASKAAEKGPSWAEVARGAPRQPEWTNHRISPRELEAMQNRFSEVVVVPEEELEAARLEWRSTTVLVRSLGRSVPGDWVAREMQRVGRLQYKVGCFPLTEGCIAVRFANEADREAALRNGPWVVGGQMLAVDRWRPNFIPGAGGIGRVVAWLRLPGLPLDYWKKETIFRIAARAGNPLALDGFTEKGSRYGFARVKVEVDSSVPLTPGTFVMGSSAGLEMKIWQSFIYENLPAPCSKCGRIGHS